MIIEILILLTENFKCGSQSKTDYPSVTIDVTEPSNVSLECSAKYYGSWAPSVSWLINGSLVNSSGNVTSASDSSYTYNVTVNGTSQNHIYTCYMFFDAPPQWVLHDDDEYFYDHSKPDFNVSCSITLNVLCK